MGILTPRTAEDPEPCDMQVVLNGQEEQIDGPTTVAGLLHHLAAEPVRVAVEVNEQVVPRKRFEVTEIHEGDRIEVVTFVGGG